MAQEAARERPATGPGDGDGRGGHEASEDNSDRDATTLDDGITQSALTFLIRVDAALAGSDPAIREAAEYGLAKLIKAQYPNGTWPARLDLKVPDALTASAWRARYPEAWPREFAPPQRPSSTA